MYKLSRMRFYFVVSLLIASALSLTSCSKAKAGDFDLSRNLVQLDKFLSGGPKKDGIPALFKSEFIPAKDATYLEKDDLVIGIHLKGQAKAYPLRVLNWHEIVNDKIADKPIAVSWCPLTRSAIIFDAKVGRELINFGVSGLLYQNNLVMYDQNSDSLWPQLQLGAVTGKFSKKKLSIVPSVVTTWGQWSKDHPESLVLSLKTGFVRNYNYDPYISYQQSPSVMFPMDEIDQRLEPKSFVLGLIVDGVAKAYPIELVEKKATPIKDIIAGKTISIQRKEDGTIYAVDQQGNLLPATLMYWFAWSVFNKNTLIWEDNADF